MAVVVVTDSSASVDPDTAKRLGIRVVPLHVLVGSRQLDEGVDEMPPDVTADGITTSAASPGEVRAAYTAALAASDGDGVVGVHISRQLSATWDAARAAADELGAGVRVVDSRAAALGTGFAAMAAARVAAAGAGLDAAYEAAVDVSRRCRCLIVVDSLDALRRGGRISTITALLGTALVTKPLLHVEDGKLALREKVRTSSKALARLVDTAVECATAAAATEAGTALAVQHYGAADRAELVAGQLRHRIPDLRELVVTEFGPTLAVHVGRGAVGVVVVPGGLPR
ncbi:MAG TPA: DegV family protein [Aldersonia sp.]